MLSSLVLSSLVRSVKSAVASSARIFLLSPARAGGPRYSLLIREQTNFELALKLRQGAATVGEVYTFISGLYFRGKMAYVEAFAAAPQGVPPALVMVPGAGLVPPETAVSLAQLEAISQIPVSENNREYRDALLSSARLIDQHAGPNCAYVLLGSVASAKYTEPLLAVFGERLLFPADFAGRGDMSRGGLMLRCAHARTELAYVPVAGSPVHGARPPKLERWRKS